MSLSIADYKIADKVIKTKKIQNRAINEKQTCFVKGRYIANVHIIIKKTQNKPYYNIT